MPKGFAATLKAMLPLRWKHRLKEFLGIGFKRGLLPFLHTVHPARRAAGNYTIAPSELVGEPGEDGFPVPPESIRMGYPDDDAWFVESGRRVAAGMKEQFAKHGVALGSGIRLLDWGCASGRVLRHFGAEAKADEIWGADIDEGAIVWDKRNLSPPFNFVTVSEYPHLPFEDRYFDAIYSVSVFTHIEYLADTWLMALRRVMKPGGVLIASVHNEDTLDYYKQYRPHWFDAALDLDAVKRHEVFVLSEGAWHNTYPFFQSEYLRREWGRYFEVVDVLPCYVDFSQTAVVARRRAG